MSKKEEKKTYATPPIPLTELDAEKLKRLGTRQSAIKTMIKMLTDELSEVKYDLHTFFEKVRTNYNLDPKREYAVMDETIIEEKKKPWEKEDESTGAKETVSAR